MAKMDPDAADTALAVWNGYCTRHYTLNDFSLVFVISELFLGANDAPLDLLQYVLWIGS
jgi:hypothetical protein